MTLSSSAAWDLTRALFEAIDARNTDAFVEFLTDDAVLRFGSAPPVQGRAGIHEMIQGFFSELDDIAHDISFVAVSDGRLVCEGDVTYTRKDGHSVSIPFADIFALQDGPGERPLIRDYRIYMDIAPLYAEAS